MFEDQIFENIMRRMLSKVPKDMDINLHSSMVR